uniref:Uncharacterized protein n=1 Tax=Trichogramma kaykai TaxID=54128 RepID=A0ABD2X6H9_9HYME
MQRSCCRRGLHCKRNSRHFSFVVVHVCNSNSISSPFFLIIMMMYEWDLGKRRKNARQCSRPGEGRD